MASTATYNGVTLPVLGKPEIGFNDGVLSISFESHLTANELETHQDALRAENNELVFTVGEYTRTFNLGTNAVTIKPHVLKPGTVIDSDGHKRLRATFNIEMQTTFANGFKSWQAQITTNEQGRVSYRITGEVSAQGSDSATTVYNAGIDAIETTVQAIAGGSQYDQPFELLDLKDRNNKGLNFERARIEMLEQSTSSAGYDAGIVLPHWSISKSVQTDRGTPQGSPHSPVLRFQCSWQAMFATSVSPTTAIAAFESAIRTLVHQRLRAQFSGVSGTLIILDNTVQFSNTENTASGNWVVQVANGTTLFEEAISSEDQERDFEKVLDGRDNTEADFSPGVITRYTQEVTHEMVGKTPPLPPPPPVSGSPTDAGGKVVRGSGFAMKRFRRHIQRSSSEIGFAGAQDGSGTAMKHRLVYSAEFALVVQDNSKPSGSSSGWNDQSAFTG